MGGYGGSFTTTAPLPMATPPPPPPPLDSAHRLWCVRALRSRNQHGSLPDANVRKKLTRDSGYGKGGAVWNDQRRRRRGLQGRPQKAVVGRGLLFEWFSVLRNSVAVHAHTPAMAGRQAWGRVAPCFVDSGDACSSRAAPAEGPRLAVDRQGEGAAPPPLQVPVPRRAILLTTAAAAAALVN